MDLISFWSQQINKWNEESKCGLCWDFTAPLVESAIELVEPSAGMDCCVQVLFLRDKEPAFSTLNRYNESTQLLSGTTCNKAFEILFLMYAPIGSNNWNEVKGHSTDESKWATALYELERCLSCDLELDFCEFIGSKSRVTKWSAKQVINFSSKNYSGYRISVNFQTFV